MNVFNLIFPYRISSFKRNLMGNNKELEKPQTKYVQI